MKNWRYIIEKWTREVSDVRKNWVNKIFKKYKAWYKLFETNKYIPVAFDESTCSLEDLKPTAAVNTVDQALTVTIKSLLNCTLMF